MDVVVDTTWQPGMARTALAALGERAGQWIYVSSNGSYDDLQQPGPADDPGSLTAPHRGDHADADRYRGAKVACEDHVRAARGDDFLIARSGLLAGPGDVSDRYGYWVARFSAAGDGPVLVPAEQDDVIQMIDVRDLARWLVQNAADGTRGTYDAVGPRYLLRELLDVSRRVAGHTGDVVAASSDFLDEHGVLARSGGDRTLPLWRPRDAGYPLVSAGPILATGVGYRPLAETTRDTLTDEIGRGLDRARKSGLTRADELELLAALGG